MVTGGDRADAMAEQGGPRLADAAVAGGGSAGAPRRSPRPRQDLQECLAVRLDKDRDETLAAASTRPDGQKLD